MTRPRIDDQLGRDTQRVQRMPELERLEPPKNGIIHWSMPFSPASALHSCIALVAHSASATGAVIRTTAISHRLKLTTSTSLHSRKQVPPYRTQYAKYGAPRVAKSN